MTAILELDALTSAGLRDAVGGRATMLDSFESLSSILRDGVAEDTIVLGPSVDAGLAFSFSERVRAQDPTIGIVLVRARIDSSVLAAAMRAGIREVVGDRDVDGLSAAVTRSQQLTRALRSGGAEGEASGPAQKQARMISVFSPKGGCGKTTISTNIGVALANSGASVVLVDLDLAFGDVAIALGLRPEHHLGEALVLGDSLDVAALAGLVCHHESGLAVLVPPNDPGESERIPSAFVSKVLGLLRTQYDYVLIDTPPQLDDRTLTVLEASDQVLMLTTLDIASLKNLRICLDTLRLVDFDMKTAAVVLNRADASVGLDPADVEKSVKAKVIAHIPSSRDVPAATNRGLAIVAENPRHPVSQAISALVKTHIAPEETVRSTRRSLFSRRKSA